MREYMPRTGISQVFDRSCPSNCSDAFGKPQWSLFGEWFVSGYDGQFTHLNSKYVSTAHVHVYPAIPHGLRFEELIKFLVKNTYGQSYFQQMRGCSLLKQCTALNTFLSLWNSDAGAGSKLFDIATTVARQLCMACAESWLAGSLPCINWDTPIWVRFMSAC